jgi:hypothetical protein
MNNKAYEDKHKDWCVDGLRVCGHGGKAMLIVDGRVYLFFFRSNNNP